MKDKDARSSLVEFREAVERADREHKAEITKVKAENRKLKLELDKAKTTADLALQIANRATLAISLLAQRYDDDDDDPPAAAMVPV